MQYWRYPIHVDQFVELLSCCHLLYLPQSLDFVHKAPIDMSLSQSSGECGLWIADIDCQHYSAFLDMWCLAERNTPYAHLEFEVFHRGVLLMRTVRQ